MERWKKMKGYEGLYKVSDYGNIYSVRYNKVMKPYKDKLGYNSVHLYKDGKRKRMKCSILVASHFVSNPENKKIVHHKDYNTSNDYYKNLKWVTHSENIQDAYDNDKISRDKSYLHKPIYCIELDMEFESIVACASYLVDNGLSKSANKWNCHHSIHRVLRGTRKSYLGLTFGYIGGDTDA